MLESKTWDVNWWKGKKVLVTGAGGYLGSSLVAELAKAECLLYRASRKELAPPAKSSKATVKDIILNLNHANVWESLPLEFDILFHLAAQTSVYEAEKDPLSDHAVNVLPMHGLIKAVSRWTRSLGVVFASTATISGIPPRLPVGEECPDAPITIYDLHKLMAENYLKLGSRCGVLRSVALRLPNVYGPGPLGVNGDRGILNRMIVRARKGDSLTVYGDGKWTRDYLYKDDVVNAFLLAGQHLVQIDGQHFYIGTGKGCSVADAMLLVATQAQLLYQKNISIEKVKPPESLSPIETRSFTADSRKFSSATGWSSTVPLVEGIRSTLESLL